MNYIKFKHFRILFLSLFSIWVFFVFAIIFGIYFNYKSTMEREMDLYIEDKAQEAESYFMEMEENLIDLSYSLVEYNDIHNLLYLNSYDVITDNQVFSFIRRIKNIYPFIDNIGLYNAKLNRYFTTDGIEYSVNFPASTDMLKIEGSQEGSYYDKNSNTVTFYVYFSFLNDKETFISYDMNIEHINGVLKNTNSSDFYVTRQYIIQDEAVLFTSDNKTDNFMGSTDKNIEVYVNDMRYFDIVTVADMGNIFHRTNRIFYWFILLAMVLFLVGFIMLMYLTKKIYIPIINLLKTMNFNIINSDDLTFNEFKFFNHKFSEYVQKINSLEKDVAYLQEPMEKSLLNSLILGVNDVDFSILDKYDNNYKYYTIINVYIEEYSSFVLKINNEQNIHYFIISNIMCEFMEKIGMITSFYSYSGYIKFLLCSDIIEIDEIISMNINRAIDVIKINFGISLSATVGETVINLNEINISYLSAIKRSEELFFKEKNSIIFQDVKRNGKLIYPNEIEKDLLIAVKNNNIIEIDSCVNLFIDYINVATFYLSKKYINELMYRIITKLDISIENYISEVDLIENEQYLFNVRSLLYHLFENVANVYFERSNRQNFELVNNVRVYIEDNYRNENLSINEIADNFNLSAVYLGRIFKNITDMSVQDYTNNIRLEEGKKILCKTDKSISQISREIGITNTNYFYTLFKKKYNITPNNYRKSIDASK